MKFKEEIEENKLNRFDIEAKINRGITSRSIKI